MTHVGPYRIESELARGGMGTVYLAHGPAGREVVVKLLNVDSERARSRLRREAAAMLRVSHPHLLALLDAGDHEGKPYLVLPYVRGESLQAHLDRKGPLPLAQALHLVTQVGEGLAAAHQNGLLHRDIKPANVLLEHAAHARLADFGLVKDVSGERAQTLTLTIAGSSLGTPGYWPREQAFGAIDQFGPASDVYSLVATLYALLCGSPPRQARNMVEAMEAFDSPIFTLAQRGARVPAALDELVQRCLIDDPTARPSLPDVLRELHEIRATAQPARIGRTALAAAAAAALVLGLLGLTFLVFERPSAIAPPAADTAAIAAPPPVGLPAWVQALPSEERPPAPLPAGLHFGDQPGDVINQRDQSVLRWIPPGRFRMGSDSGLSNQAPSLEVTFVQGYFLGKYECSRGQYARFCQDTGHRKPTDWIADRDSPQGRFVSTLEHPVFDVSWNDAVAYCTWARLRLPSEAEWEFAARGRSGGLYPWGNDAPDGSRLNLADQGSAIAAPRHGSYARSNWNDGFRFLSPVGSFPAGASPFGCLDMAGNVWEWTQDAYMPTLEFVPQDGTPLDSSGVVAHVNRGGAYYNPPDRCLSTVRDYDHATNTDRGLGFRGARSSD